MPSHANRKHNILDMYGRSISLIRKGKLSNITIGDLKSFKNDSAISHISERQVDSASKTSKDPNAHLKAKGLEEAKRAVPKPEKILITRNKILGEGGFLHGISFHPNQHVVKYNLHKKVIHVVGNSFHF